MHCACVAKLHLPHKRNISAMTIATHIFSSLTCSFTPKPIRFLKPYRFHGISRTCLLTLIAGVVFCAINLLSAQTLRGTVRDADNGDAVTGATVVLQFSRGGAAPISLATSPTGEFVFEKIRAGYYSVEISAKGFENQTIVEVFATSGKEQVLDIALRRSTAQLAEVTILATQPGRRALLPLGEIPLTRDQTMRFPAMFFDPARLAAAYPGVAQTDDGTNSLSIRGNSPAYVGWRLEGVDIVNPNHLPNAGTFSDRPAAASGGILMFSAQLLDNSSLLTGAMPAGYGDALGGIMDMNLRRGNNRQHEFTAQAGLVGLDLAAEGPLSRRSSTVDRQPSASYLVNYRYSTVGLLGQLGVSFGDEQINFQDLSFNLNFSGKRGGRWSLFGLGGLSENIFRHKTDTAEIKAYKDFFDIDFESKTGVLGVSNWFPLWENAWIKTTLAVSGQTSERVSVSPIFSQRGSFDNLDESKYSAAITFSQRLGRQFKLLAGVNGTQQKFRGESIVESLAQEIPSHNYFLAQPWSQITWNSENAKTTINLGLHSLFFPYADYKTRSSYEPRMSITQILAKNHRISLSAGKYSQVAPLWLLDDDIDLLRSWGAGLSYFGNFTNNWSFKTEFFWERQTNAGVDREQASSFSILNEMEYRIYLLKYLEYKGLGENKGIELSTERRLTNGWFLLANLTLLDSRYQGSDGVWRDTRWNVKQLTNLTLGKEWQREKRPGKERIIGLNLRGVWTGGIREAEIDLAASRNQRTTVYNGEDGFSNQYPDYFRIDLRVYWRKNLGNRRNSTFALDIQNVTGQQNLAYHYYDPYTDKIENKFQLGTIPNFSWRVEF